jgi:hypothetical protein
VEALGEEAKAMMALAVDNSNSPTTSPSNSRKSPPTGKKPGDLNSW